MSSYHITDSILLTGRNPCLYSAGSSADSNLDWDGQAISGDGSLNVGQLLSSGVSPLPEPCCGWTL